MSSWVEFVAAEPLLASAVTDLLTQYGPGLAYLATVRADGGPRVHPVSPVITADGLYCFVVESPKRRDLERDGRYALHSYPAEANDDEAYLSGRVTPVDDRDLVSALAARTRAEPRVNWRLFSMDVEVAMLVQRGQPAAGRTQPVTCQVWRG